MTTDAGNPAKLPSDSAGSARLTRRDWLDPRHWPVWLALGVLRLLVLLPWRLQMGLGRALGRGLYYLLPGRSRAAELNLQLCFPELDRDRRDAMVREQFEHVGRSVFETAITWWRRPAWFRGLCTVEGEEHVRRAQEGGRGVLMVTPHYTALEIGCTGIADRYNLCASFEPPAHPLIHKLLLRGRRRHSDIIVDSSDLRGMIRALRAGRILFFAPDQTLRRARGTVVAPFFGMDVVTSAGTSRLATMTGARVLLLLPLRRRDGRGYRLIFRPPLEDFPSGDVAADTARVNEYMAEHIREYEPAQYFWLHQRFKRGRSKFDRIPFATPLKPPPWAYRIASLALAPLFALHTLRRAARDGGPVYRQQRRGRALEALPRGAIWIHAASVGEVAAVMPLLQRLAGEHSEPLLLSTNTPTGHAVAEQRAPAGTAICYLPVDRPRPVRRFVRGLAPRVALVMETELWPWLYAELDHAAVPIVIVNGRLSARTRRAPRWLRPTLRDCLKRCRLILARSEDDADAFRHLGGSRKRTLAIGNLKYADTGDAVAAIDPGRPFVLAASTHHDEELQLARAWRAAQRDSHVLAIAPRHPERGDAIAHTLAEEGLVVARRSRGEPVTATTNVYLADTMGELTALMAGADVVIMGGSFIPHGGQNLLEPARLGRALVVGPHMDNFRDETEHLEAAGGVVRAEDAPTAIATAIHWLDHPAERDAIAARARQAVAGDDDVVERYLEQLRAMEL